MGIQDRDLDFIRNNSAYLGRLLRRREYLRWLGEQNNLLRRYPLTELYRDLKSTASSSECDFRGLQQGFREFKQRHFLRIGGRDLLGMDDFSRTTLQVSELAEVALQVAVEVLGERPELWCCGMEPQEAKTVLRNSPVVVLGLGKLGGRELNYASDVDLLLLKRYSGEVSAHRRFCQTLCRLLGDQEAGDRVFKVDLRLRPMGKDGELVPPMEAASEYYLNSGQAWERQVLLKARPVAGERGLGKSFVQEVRPFVFRRFLDFQALEELQGMRDRILAELKQSERDLLQDVKLGRGGIREIEFLVQSFQLIYGGRYPELSDPNTLSCLGKLEQLGLTSPDLVRQLESDYVFLRRVEHWLQLDQNRQVRRVPEEGSDLQRLASALGWQGEPWELLQGLRECGERIHSHFAALFQSGSRAGGEASFSGEDREETGPSALRTLEQIPGALNEALSLFSDRFRQRIASVLEEFARGREELSPQIISRLERFLRQASSRTGLARMLDAGPDWLEDVLRGTIRSGMVASLLAHNPALVEGISTAGRVEQGFESWSRRGESILGDCHVYDEAMEWIRRLRNERILMIALAEQKGRLSAEQASEELSSLADFVIRHTYAWVRHRVGLGPDLPLAVLTLGKLGSREFGYLSDLDLMFVYDPPPGEDEEMIPERVVRVIQRLMRMLSTPLQEGPGYVVDAQLRPTGNYGPLTVTRKAWEEYYCREADIWELQALLRLRSVAGNHELGRYLEQLAHRICFVPRPQGEVRSRLCHLRRRMERERSQDRENAIDVKLGYGGVADLEFMVQGAQLILGHASPHLAQRRTSFLVETASRELGFSEQSAANLRLILHTYRSLEHRLQLESNRTSSRVTAAQLQKLQQVGLWPPQEGHSSVNTWEELKALQRRVRNCWSYFCGEYGAHSDNNP